MVVDLDAGFAGMRQNRPDSVEAPEQRAQGGFCAKGYVGDVELTGGCNNEP